MIIFPKMECALKKGIVNRKNMNNVKIYPFKFLTEPRLPKFSFVQLFSAQKKKFSSIVLAEYSPLFAGQRRRGQRANERPVSRSCDHSRPIIGQQAGAEGTRRDMNSTQPWRQQQLLQSSWPLIGRE